jgi:mycothiol synthase
VKTSIAYPMAPEVDGLTFRHVVVPDDLPAMNRIANIVRRAEGDNWATSDDQFVEFYTHLRNCDPATDIVIVERDGRMVGYGRASWRENGDGSRSYEPTNFGLPEEGPALLDALFQTTEARCREIAGTHPSGPKHFDADAMDVSTARVQVMRARGYEPVRWSYAMVRPTLDPLPDSPLPEGLEIRPVKPEHLRAIYEHERRAFQDGWEYSAETTADYEHFLHDPVQGDYTLWRVAWDGDHVAGSIRGYINEAENEAYGRKRGFVENINTGRQWRRRGVARALIAATIDALRERGMTEGALSVDTQNPSGALHLYESCGFEVEAGGAVYRKPLD